MILLIENNIRGGISSLLCDRFVNSDEKKKILYIDATNFICSLNVSDVTL